LTDILSITGPIFLLIGLGFLATRYGLFGRDEIRFFGRYVLLITLPAMLFYGLATRSFAEVLRLDYLAAYAAGSALMFALGFVYARWVRGHAVTLSSYVAAGMSWSNSVYIGYPILYLSLGSIAGVVLAMNLLIELTLMFILLQVFAELGREKTSLVSEPIWLVVGKRLGSNSAIWAIALGFASSISGLKPPGPVMKAIELVATSGAALALFTIGGTLVGMKVSGLRGVIAETVLAKLILHPVVVAVVVIYLLPIADGALAKAAILSACVPVFSIYPILAQRHRLEEVCAASTLVATVLSFVTLSVGLAIVLR
jgi:malonate transporter